MSVSTQVTIKWYRFYIWWCNLSRMQQSGGWSRCEVASLSLMHQPRSLWDSPYLWTMLSLMHKHKLYDQCKRGESTGWWVIAAALFAPASKQLASAFFCSRLHVSFDLQLRDKSICLLLLGILHQLPSNTCFYIKGVRTVKGNSCITSSVSSMSLTTYSLDNDSNRTTCSWDILELDAGESIWS